MSKVSVRIRENEITVDNLGPFTFSVGKGEAMADVQLIDPETGKYSQRLMLKDEAAEKVCKWVVDNLEAIRASGRKRQEHSKSSA